MSIFDNIYLRIEDIHHLYVSKSKSKTKTRNKYGTRSRVLFVMSLSCDWASLPLTVRETFLVHKILIIRGTLPEKGLSLFLHTYITRHYPSPLSFLSPSPLLLPLASSAAGGGGGAMKVSIKTLKGSSFEIDVEPTSKVRRGGLPPPLL